MVAVILANNKWGMDSFSEPELLPRPLLLQMSATDANEGETHSFIHINTSYKYSIFSFFLL